MIGNGRYRAEDRRDWPCARKGECLFEKGGLLDGRLSYRTVHGQSVSKAFAFWRVLEFQRGQSLLVGLAEKNLDRLGKSGKRHASTFALRGQSPW